MQKISIIIPCFNEEKNIPLLFKRIKKIFDDFDTKLMVQFVFIDDGSSDETWQVLNELVKNQAKNSKNIIIDIFQFSRNFGHQNAVCCGIENSNGEALVIIDADLQDPPEIIPEMIQKWQSGYEVVYAQRKKRRGESFLKLFSASFFYRILQKTTQIDIPVDTGDFRLIDKKIADVFLGLREKNKFIRGLISWIGFKQTSVEYVRDKRHTGKTKYTLSKMLNFALDGITGFSSTPLKLASYFGGFGILVAIGIAIYSLVAMLVFKNSVSGWTSLILTIIFFASLQLLSLGVIGEYIRRIYDEVKDRPNFIVGKKKSSKGKGKKKQKEK